MPGNAVSGGRILTMTDVRGIRTADELRAWLASMKSLRPRLLQHGLREVPEVDVDLEAAPAEARVNHGEWIADCPESGCGGAVLLVPGAPFFCPSCLNARVGFRWRPVEWPDDAEASAIEAALLRQPMVQLRNWEPGIDSETLAAAVESELRGRPPRRVQAIRAALRAQASERKRSR